MTFVPIPLNQTQGYIDGDRGLLQRMEASWQEGSPLWLQFMAEADVDTRMYVGDQEALYSYGARTFNYWRRNQLTANKLRPPIQMISGNQRKNRKTSIYVPQEPQDQDAADELTSSLLFSMRSAKAFNLVSDAFEACLVSGLSLIYSYMDYSSDPLNGDIRSSLIKYPSVFMDPFGKRRDLTDTRYIWTRKWLDRDRIKMLLAGREKDVDRLPLQGNSDGRFAYQPEALNYQQRNLLIYDEYWYSDTRKKDLLLDMDSGETYDWKEEKKGIEPFLQWAHAHGGRLKHITKVVPTIRYGVVVQNQPMLDLEAPDGLDIYPFSPFYCFFNPEISYMPHKIQGLVRNGRDLQWAYNLRQRLQLDYLQAGINRGYIYPEDVPVNPDNLTDNKGNGVNIPIKAGRDPNLLKDIPPAQIPPSWFDQMSQLEKDINQTLEASEELMGSASDDQAGVLSMLRQGAGLTMLNPLFDGLDQSQALLAKIYTSLQQENWSVGKFARILGKDPHPYIKNKYITKFDIDCVDGSLTPNQQWMEFQQLFEMFKAGLPVDPALILQKAPMQNKKDLIESMNAQKQGAQAQAQAQMQAEIQVSEAQAALLKSQAQANQGIAEERSSKVQENRAMAFEKIEEAKLKNQQAELDKVKALKELQSMNIEDLERAVRIFKAIQEKEVAKEV